MVVAKKLVPLLKTLGLILLVSSVAVAGKPGGGGGKGGGKGDGGGDPPPPPVHYRVTWLDQNGWPEAWGSDPEIRIRATDMNNAGIVVGYASDGSLVQSRAFCSVAGMLMDLNELSQTWIEIDDESQTPVSGWIATVASGINESGSVVGTAKHQETDEARVFMLHYTETGATFFAASKGWCWQQFRTGHQRFRRRRWNVLGRGVLHGGGVYAVVQLQRIRFRHAGRHVGQHQQFWGDRRTPGNLHCAGWRPE